MGERKSARRRAPGLKAQIADEAVAIQGRLEDKPTDRFARADKVMGIDDSPEPEGHQVTRVGFAAPRRELEAIERIQDRCLDKRLVLSRSEVFRIALAHLDEASVEDRERHKATLPVLKSGPKGPRKK
ncbi:MAG: hypothetical protein OEU26_16430 [Candidatus Tectomicrobia bacterium]|nr:hypothetical protein [Candidatus Tectomicrobia bacterium]